MQYTSPPSLIFCSLVLSIIILYMSAWCYHCTIGRSTQHIKYLPLLILVCCTKCFEFSPTTTKSFQCSVERRFVHYSCMQIVLVTMSSQSSVFMLLVCRRLTNKQANQFLVKSNKCIWFFRRDFISPHWLDHYES